MQFIPPQANTVSHIGRHVELAMAKSSFGIHSSRHPGPSRPKSVSDISSETLARRLPFYGFACGL